MRYALHIAEMFSNQETAQLAWHYHISLSYYLCFSGIVCTAGTAAWAQLLTGRRDGARPPSQGGCTGPLRGRSGHPLQVPCQGTDAVFDRAIDCSRFSFYVAVCSGGDGFVCLFFVCFVLGLFGVLDWGGGGGGGGLEMFLVKTIM